MTPEKQKRARRVVETTIRERLDDIVFYKILIALDTERYDDDDDLDYLDIKAIYEGERERLRTERIINLRRLLRERLLDEGVTEFPILSLTMKSEWKSEWDPEWDQLHDPT